MSGTPNESEPSRAPEAPPAAPDPPIAAPLPVAKPTRTSRSPLSLTASILGWAVVIPFYGSLLWALAYRFVPPPATLTMFDRMLSGDDVDHPWTPLSGISPHLVRAVIAAEDSRFCLHGGFDYEAIDEAIDHNKRARKRRGASTISQQTAKNAFLWNGGGWVRKAAEAWFTLVVETIWSKRRIMEVYLNIAEWGDGHFGAEAAARARFGKSATDLTAQEAALLAAVLPSPNKWRVDPPGPYVQRRAGMLRKRMEVVRNDGLDACVFRYASSVKR